jgi:hypothetical protein
VGSPQDGLAIVKPNASHVGLGCIGGPRVDEVTIDKFVNGGRSCRADKEGAEGFELHSDGTPDLDPCATIGNGCLENGELSMTSRYAREKAAELAKDLLPVFAAGSGLA